MKVRSLSFRWLVGIVIAIALIAWCCVGGSDPYRPNQPTWRLLSADGSGSNAFDQADATGHGHIGSTLSAQAKQGASFLAHFACSLDPARDRVNISVFSDRVQEIASEVPTSYPKFLKRLEDAIRTAPKKGTEPALFFEQVVTQIRERPDDRRAVEVGLSWDGDLDDMSPAMLRRLDVAIAAIAGDPRFRSLIIWNVRDRAVINGHLRPILGDRLHLCQRGEAPR